MSNSTGLGDDSTLEKIMKLVGNINGVGWFLSDESVAIVLSSF